MPNATKKKTSAVEAIVGLAIVVVLVIGLRSCLGCGGDGEKVVQVPQGKALPLVKWSGTMPMPIDILDSLGVKVEKSERDKGHIQVVLVTKRCYSADTIIPLTWYIKRQASIIRVDETSPEINVTFYREPYNSDEYAPYAYGSYMPRCADCATHLDEDSMEISYKKGDERQCR